MKCSPTSPAFSLAGHLNRHFPRPSVRPAPGLWSDPVRESRWTNPGRTMELLKGQGSFVKVKLGYNWFNCVIFLWNIWWYPKIWMVFVREDPTKIDDFGGPPYFRTPPTRLSNKAQMFVSFAGKLWKLQRSLRVDGLTSDRGAFCKEANGLEDGGFASCLTSGATQKHPDILKSSSWLAGNGQCATLSSTIFLSLEFGDFKLAMSTAACVRLSRIPGRKPKACW